MGRRTGAASRASAPPFPAGRAASTTAALRPDHEAPRARRRPARTWPEHARFWRGSNMQQPEAVETPRATGRGPGSGWNGSWNNAVLSKTRQKAHDGRAIWQGNSDGSAYRRMVFAQVPTRAMRPGRYFRQTYTGGLSRARGAASFRWTWAVSGVGLSRSLGYGGIQECGAAGSSVTLARVPVAAAMRFQVSMEGTARPLSRRAT